MTRKIVDWEAIEREYRAGQLSVREIGRGHDVSAPAILKRAKLRGWTRDLTAAVRKAVSAKLSVDTEVNTDTARDAEIVEGAALRGAEVVHRHRRDIARLNSLKDRLANKAEVLLDGIADIKDLTDAASAVESLGRTSSRLIPLERQAFNLDDNSAPSARATFVIET